MKAWEIVAYAYDASLHCRECALKHFGKNPDGLLDSEGNEVHPIFASDELDPFGNLMYQSESCVDCGLMFFQG